MDYLLEVANKIINKLEEHYLVLEIRTNNNNLMEALEITTIQVKEDYSLVEIIITLVNNKVGLPFLIKILNKKHLK